MFCARCGEQIPDAIEVCPLCGREATLRLNPPAPTVPPNVPAPNVSAAVSEPNGVGGWLLVYCVGLTCVAPFYILMNLSATPIRSDNTYYLIDIVRIAYGFVVGVLLWTRRSVSLLLLKGYFFFIAAATLLYALELVRVAMQTHSSIFAEARFTSLFVGTGVTLLWFAYFRKSVRVKNTYGENL